MNEEIQRRFFRREVENLLQTSQNKEDFVLQLYEEYVDLVYRYFYTRFKNLSDTRKLISTERFTQETFMRVIEVVGHGLSPWGNRPFALWLFNMMNNMLREQYGEQDYSLPGASNNDAYYSQEDQKKDILWQLVYELPVPERQILILRHVYKLSYSDLAIYLKRDETACRQLYTQAMRNLQQLVHKMNIWNRISNDL